MPAIVPLVVEADLSIEYQSQAGLRVHGNGQVLQASLDSMHIGIQLARQARLNSAFGRQTLSQLAQLLSAADLVLEVRVRQHLIARLGAGARSGAVSRLAGVPGVELHPTAIIRALVTRGR